MVECGGLENRFICNPGNEGSNPSSSASELIAPRKGARCFAAQLELAVLPWATRSL